MRSERKGKCKEKFEKHRKQRHERPGRKYKEGVRPEEQGRRKVKGGKEDKSVRKGRTASDYEGTEVNKNRSVRNCEKSYTA